MDIEVINANILTAKEDIIVQQVNCQGVMGAGLALAIKKKYPMVYTKYMAVCNNANPNDLLGRVQSVHTTDHKIIINMFSQLNYGRGKKQTDYEAMKRCFYKIYLYAKLNNLTVAIPYNIGCGLAGGNWTVVLNIILKTFKDKSIVKLYKI